MELLSVGLGWSRSQFSDAHTGTFGRSTGRLFGEKEPSDYEIDRREDPNDNRQNQFLVPQRPVTHQPQIVD